MAICVGGSIVVRRRRHQVVADVIRDERACVPRPATDQHLAEQQPADQQPAEKVAAADTGRS